MKGGKPPAGVFAHRLRVTTVVDKRFDGDTTSANALLSDEAIAEAFKHLHSVRAYVRPDGSFTNSAAVDTVERVLHNLTGDPL